MIKYKLKYNFSPPLKIKVLKQTNNDKYPYSKPTKKHTTKALVSKISQIIYVQYFPL